MWVAVWQIQGCNFVKVASSRVWAEAHTKKSKSPNPLFILICWNTNTPIQSRKVSPKRFFLHLGHKNVLPDLWVKDQFEKERFIESASRRKYNVPDFNCLLSWSINCGSKVGQFKSADARKRKNDLCTSLRKLEITFY